MKKILYFIRYQFRVTYRLTIIENGNSRNIYGRNRRMLCRMAYNDPKMEYWSIYKVGPFGIPEREVDNGVKGGKR